jgi:hypothetical protein
VESFNEPSNNSQDSKKHEVFISQARVKNISFYGGISCIEFITQNVATYLLGYFIIVIIIIITTYSTI